MFNSAPSQSDWADRSNHWLSQSTKSVRPQARRERIKSPLVLCGHGVSISVEAGTLCVRDGLTHYPQERRSFRFFRGDLNLPRKIIMLDGTGGLSFDALAWLSEQGVTLIKLGYQGDAVSIVGGSATTFDADLVEWQIATRNDPDRRLAFCCDLIADKVRASIVTLHGSIPATPARDAAIHAAEIAIRSLEARAARTVNDVLMIEARAAAAYFTAWRGLPLRWKSKGRHPVPDAWLIAGSRRTVRDSRFATNRNATHPVNAMLNYAYGVLHSHVQMDAVAAGYDPTKGIMHESRPDARALILDLMERQRPVADAQVLKFIAAQTFSGADFTIREDGVCRLSPQLARRVCGLITGVVTV